MIARRALFAFTVAGLLVVGAVAACGDDKSTAVTTTDGGPDAQPDVPAVVTNDTETKQTGKIIRAQTDNEGVPGATVTVAGKSATTNQSGDYELIVPRNTPYQMKVTADGYYNLLDQELFVKKPLLDRGATNLLATSTAEFLAGLLDGRKKEKGLVLVKVNPQEPCTSEEGSTLTMDPPGEAKLTYFGSLLPDRQQTSAKAGTTFTAIFYNVEVGVPVTVTVSSPLCKQAAFPVEIGDVTYTGVQKAEAGDAISYLRLYIKDPAEKDAGADAN